MNKKVIDFFGKRKIFFGISIGLILIGIVCNIIFGTTLDIQFTGGTMIKYTYNNEINEQELESLLQTATPDDRITIAVSRNMIAGQETATSDQYLVTVQFSGKNTITMELQDEITAQLQEKFPDNNFVFAESSTVESSMGGKFFQKCLAAVILACALMVLYVTLRFKKIGGLSAGVMALVALLHDVTIVYFCFIMFRMPLDSNFIAVVLMILGYSLNDTIVIYDRIRENKSLMGNNAPIEDLFNKSMTQVYRRTIFTSLTTLSAILCVLIVSIIFNLTTVTSFALPMVFGVISGSYSSLFIAGPLWVTWQRSKKKKAEKK